MHAHFFRSLKTRLTLAILLVFLLAIWSLFFYTHWLLMRDTRELVGQQQYSTARYVAAEIDEHVQNRLEALAKIAQEIDVSMLERPAALEKQLARYELADNLFNDGIFVYRKDGTSIATRPHAP